MNFIQSLLKFIISSLLFILSIKFLTWAVLVSTIYISLFRIYNAELTNNVLASVLMLLLLTLFSDLKEFNFWGLWGKKKEIPEEIRNAEAISRDTPTQNVAFEKQIDAAERQPIIQLMDTDKGNFLYIVFEIERLMRIAAQTVLGRNIGSLDHRIIKQLRDNDFLTDSGVKQYEALKWLRNIYVHGKDNEVTPRTLSDGINLGLNFYRELYNWLYPEQKRE